MSEHYWLKQLQKPKENVYHGLSLPLILTLDGDLLGDVEGGEVFGEVVG